MNLADVCLKIHILVSKTFLLIHFIQTDGVDVVPKIYLKEKTVVRQAKFRIIWEGAGIWFLAEPM